MPYRISDTSDKALWDLLIDGNPIPKNIPFRKPIHAFSFSSMNDKKKRHAVAGRPPLTALDGPLTIAIWFPILQTCYICLMIE